MDLLIWAVLANRMELARSIWRETTLPIHSALVACQLYLFLLHALPLPMCPPFIHADFVDIDFSRSSGVLISLYISIIQTGLRMLVIVS